MQKNCACVVVLALLLYGTASGQAEGPWRASQSNTRGWEFMTPQERIEHQSRVRGFTDFDECEAYRTHHHDLMAERARQQGMLLNDGARDFCDRLRPRGRAPPGTN